MFFFDKKSCNLETLEGMFIDEEKVSAKSTRFLWYLKFYLMEIFSQSLSSADVSRKFFVNLSLMS